MARDARTTTHSGSRLLEGAALLLAALTALTALGRSEASAPACGAPVQAERTAGLSAVAFQVEPADRGALLGDMPLHD